MLCWWASNHVVVVVAAASNSATAASASNTDTGTANTANAVEGGNHHKKEPWLFLFAGQSNMIGHSNYPSTELPTYLFDTFFNHTLADQPPSLDGLTDVLMEEYSKKFVYNHTYYAELQAQQLHQLVYQNQRLGNPRQLKEPHPNAQCYFSDPSDNDDDDNNNNNNSNQLPGTQNKVVPLQPNANCGNSYGHELAFAHAMTTSGAIPHDQPFQIIKVAADKRELPDGQLELNEDWDQNDGKYGQYLLQEIRSHANQGKYVGFVWHQGENDCFVRNNHIPYSTKLEALITSVRQELYNANTNRKTTSGGSSGEWKSYEEVPVAIMSLSLWPKHEHREGIAQAQVDFVNQDGGHSVVVPIQHLGPHGYLDAVDLLISGERLASYFSPLIQVPEEKDSKTTVSVVLVLFFLCGCGCGGWWLLPTWCRLRWRYWCKRLRLRSDEEEMSFMDSLPMTGSLFKDNFENIFPTAPPQFMFRHSDDAERIGLSLVDLSPFKDIFEDEAEEALPKEPSKSTFRYSDDSVKKRINLNLTV